ncbi:MAG: hypothetical protein R6U95_04030 [Bacteroidales bacterium]
MTHKLSLFRVHIDYKLAISLIGVFIIHFFARYFYIDAVSLWYDESFSVFHAQGTCSSYKSYM